MGEAKRRKKLDLNWGKPKKHSFNSWLEEVKSHDPGHFDDLPNEIMEYLKNMFKFQQLLGENDGYLRKGLFQVLDIDVNDRTVLLANETMREIHGKDVFNQCWVSIVDIDFNYDIGDKFKGEILPIEDAPINVVLPAIKVY